MREVIFSSISTAKLHPNCSLALHEWALHGWALHEWAQRKSAGAAASVLLYITLSLLKTVPVLKKSEAPVVDVV